LEERGKELEKTLAEPDIIRDKERYLPLLNEYTEGRNELKNLMEEWEGKQEELTSAEKKVQKEGKEFPAQSSKVRRNNPGTQNGFKNSTLNGACRDEALAEAGT